MSSSKGYFFDNDTEEVHLTKKDEGERKPHTALDSITDI
jgi:hypothetical protein